MCNSTLLYSVQIPNRTTVHVFNRTYIYTTLNVSNRTCTLFSIIQLTCTLLYSVQLLIRTTVHIKPYIYLHYFIYI